MGAHNPPGPGRHRRALLEVEVHQALARLSHSERLEALRDVPLARSDKLCGPSRIVLVARGRGLLDHVLEAIRSYPSPRSATAGPMRPVEPPSEVDPTTHRPSKRRKL